MLETYYFGLNLSLMLLIKVYFFVFNRYFIGAILSKKSLAKSEGRGEGFEKMDKKGKMTI